MIKKLYLPLVALLVLALSSCGKMGELSSDYFTTNPEVLEAIGGKVPVTINGKFPEKYFKKNATVEVTPVLRWKGGEAKGQPAVFQGEKVEGNLVYTRIKAPAHKELVQKLADMQTDENIKQDILTITHTVDNYIYSLDKKEVCFAGRFFINAKDEIILQDNRVSDFIPVPSDKPVVSKVYENLKAQEKAGKIQ